MSENTLSSNLELDEIIGILGGSVKDLKKFVRDRDIDDGDLERLLKAEKSAKNRKTAVEFLKDRLNHEDDGHQDYEESVIGKLKAVKNNGEPRIVVDINGIKFDLDSPQLNFAGHKFTLTHEKNRDPENNVFSSFQKHQESGNPGTNSFGNLQRAGRAPANTAPPQESQLEELEQQEIKKLKEQQKQLEKELEEEVKKQHELEETREELVEKLQGEFEDKDLKGKSLEELKDLEDLKDRREAKRSKLQEKFDLEKNKLENKNLEELEELEQNLERLKSKKEMLLEKYDLSSSQVENKNFKELEEFEDKLEERRAKRDELKRRYKIPEAEVEGKTLEELNNLETKLKEKNDLANKLSKYGYNPRKLQKKDIEELNRLIDQIKEKKDILDQINVNIDDKELKDTKLEELKAVKEEKEQREDLLEELRSKGFDQEDLNNCSNRDLENLLEDLNKKEEDSKKNEEMPADSPDIDQNGKPPKQEIEREAEEDLELLMGATKKEDEEDGEKDDKNSRNKIKDLELQFKKSWENLMATKKESSDDERNKDKFIDLMEEYRDLDDKREKLIKTAQIMKAYIESTLKIDHELTYKEIAENLEDLDKDDEDIKTAIKFFKRVHLDTYSGNMHISNPDHFIDASENLVEKLG